MARRYAKSRYRGPAGGRRFTFGSAFFTGLCCAGLCLLIYSFWDDGTPSPPAHDPAPGVPGEVTAIPNEANPRLQGPAETLRHDPVNNPLRMIEVRDRLNEMLREPADDELGAQIRKELSQLARKWLFGPECLPGDTLCAAYKVRAGDLLSQIGKANHVPWELLAEINGIANPRSLRIGQTIKIVRGPFHAFVSLSGYTMDLYLQETYVLSFPVGLARPGKRTPAGTWLVKDRIRDAAWTDPDTGQTLHPNHLDYPLGPVWMPLEGISGDALGQASYGIHGTNDPENVGTAASRGCIRLLNEDAEKVFDLLMPGHSRVTIAE